MGLLVFEYWGAKSVRVSECVIRERDCVSLISSIRDKILGL